jgi:hypothetical protein
MASPFAGCGVEVVARGGEHPLPGPFAGSGRVLKAEGAREIDVAGAVAEVEGVLAANAFEVLSELRCDASRQQGNGVVPSFALTNDDVPCREVHVLDAQGSALGDSQARPIEELGHKARGSLKVLEDEVDFLPREHDRQAWDARRALEVFESRQIEVQHVAIEKDDGAKGLLMSRGARATLGDEHIEKRPNLRGAARARIAPVITHETRDPSVVGLARPDAVVSRRKCSLNEHAKWSW